MRYNHGGVIVVRYADGEIKRIVQRVTIVIDEGSLFFADEKQAIADSLIFGKGL